MSYWKPIFATTACVMSTTGSALYADVTGQQVWDSTRSLMEAYGTVSATQTVSGDTLNVSDISISLGIDGQTIDADYPDLSFVTRNDGTVEIIVPESFSTQVTATVPDVEPVTMDYTLKHTGLTIIASGDPDAIIYDLGGDTLSYTLDGMSRTETDPTGRGEIVMTDLEGRYSLSGDSLRSLEAEMTVAKADFTMALETPDSEDNLSIMATLADLEFEGETEIPQDIEFGDTQALLSSGFSTDATLNHGPLTYSMTTSNRGQTNIAHATLGSGNLSVDMSKDTLSYAGGSDDLSITVSGSAVPFPKLEMTMAEYGFQLTTPLAVSDAAQRFALQMNMTEFSISDFIWGLFDPAGTLPRDPATIAMDLSGRANWLVDILNPIALETAAQTGQVPGRLEQLTLNGLEVSVAGARLTGEGDFTFDNDDLVTFDGFPKPKGSIDLSLLGGNGLLDKLTAIGLVPQEQVLGVRLMMGLFARPGEGEDSLVSKIEVTEEGGILANGQRLN